MQSLFKKIRSFFWITTGVFKRKYKIIIICTLISILALFLWVNNFHKRILNLVYTKQKIVGIVGINTPANMPLSIQQLISSGLTKVSDDGTAEPSLAESWQITNEGKTYTFKLKSGLFWHDGTKFVSGNINYQLKDVEFKPIDDLTLVINIKDSFSPLLTYLSKPLFKKGLVGIGFYKVENLKLIGDDITYLKLKSVNTELPGLEIKFYATEDQAKTAFKLGEINTIEEINDPSPFDNWKILETDRNVKYNRYVALFFNVADQFLKDKEVRQGLSYALEKSWSNRATSPISTKSFAYTSRVKQYEQDIDLAKKLLGNDISTKSVVLSAFPQHYDLAKKIASDWLQVGLTTKIKIVDIVPDDYQILLATQEIPLDPDVYIYWHSTQKQTNLSHYVNPKIDKLLEDGRKELDPEKRKKIYFDFQRYLTEDSPAVFLYHPVTYTITRK